MNTKHIWEGWTVQDFINELEVTASIVFSDRGDMPWQTKLTKAELKKWCKSEQPYYKKHIPEVFNHFVKKFNVKN